MPWNIANQLKIKWKDYVSLENKNETLNEYLTILKKEERIF